MGKNKDASKAKKKDKAKIKAADVVPAKKAKGTSPAAETKFTEKTYLKELKKLHVELVNLQLVGAAEGPQGLHRVRGA